MILETDRLILRKLTEGIRAKTNWNMWIDQASRS
jgi:hypothetical protein